MNTEWVLNDAKFSWVVICDNCIRMNPHATAATITATVAIVFVCMLMLPLSLFLTSPLSLFLMSPLLPSMHRHRHCCCSCIDIAIIVVRTSMSPSSPLWPSSSFMHRYCSRIRGRHHHHSCVDTTIVIVCKSSVMLLWHLGHIFSFFPDHYVLIWSPDHFSCDCLLVQQSHLIGNSIVPSFCIFSIVLFLW